MVIRYYYKEKIKVKNTILERLQDIINNKYKMSLCNISSKSINFILEADINGYEKRLNINIKIEGDNIYEIAIDTIDKDGKINEYHLKSFIMDLISQILTDEHNEKFTQYTVRTYSRIFNSSPIENEILINGDYKVLIKPYNWTTRQEPLTEQIVMYDIEIEAVNVEHARSIAYNYSKNLNAYLSVLLDTSFELISSEFRVFVIKEGNLIDLRRFRTGFIDDELGLIVQNNLNGLIDAYNMDEINSFHRGKEIFTMANEEGIPSGEADSFIINATNTNDFFERKFKEHSIKTKKGDSKLEEVKIQKQIHFPNMNIKIPNEIRKYFKNISLLDRKMKDSFLSSARMYNLSLIFARQESTAEASYMICAVETLSKFEKISFSGFMKEYVLELNDGDKKLLDYYYTIRSGHFHSGQFYFGEFEVSLLSEVNFVLKEKTNDYYRFKNLIRKALVSWIEKKILSI